MFQLVKFSCGCVGTKPVEGTSTVIKSCDGEGELAFYPRTLDKAFESLSPEETEEFRSQIEQLIYDGYSMRTARAALGFRPAFKKLME